MPMIRIDVTQGRTPEDLAAVSKAIHAAVVGEYRIPEGDYFHVVTEHPRGQVVALDAGLGFERSDGVVMIQVFTQRGRSGEAKAALFAAIARELQGVGVAGEDVFIGYVENGAEDWSFGFGRAQYSTGELATPDTRNAS
ncbi:tautomerase family protein [Paeniglutamicibacter psychrophenolicus]|uniref:Phenylpyruvate tautomerase PptA (4-oxalocrotonate tautomerase family) n=1 Tax=Paeniglutamicibacter psychrophenolicus TaxID=257454 RepID=A0ABS4WJE4_9MICC|nr:tautomerase family protein [Paeniglutamicibacter psychrophenolicus]MBP2376318.1 phenylpyruvate tautomerase PptA (4-oxalocrotonate tautomerase family) [Paeniglutamicibacter psychrophenolicus]